MEQAGIPFAKGHGTGNDFVIIPDPDGRLDLPPPTVAAVCDRHFGVGGDGLLRVVRTAAEPPVAAHAGVAEWFMDYRNADGSVAEICGNGVRVFARYLVEFGLAAGPAVAIWTRAGRVLARVGEAEVAVDMPVPPVAGPAPVRAAVRVGGTQLDATIVDAGNPHLVAWVDDWVDDLDALDLSAPLELAAGLFPRGANVEFLARAGNLSVRMRVVERGVGETLSCGSGAVAAAAVVLRDAGLDTGEVAVETRGGQLRVSIEPGHCVLAGPAVIVASGTLAGLPGRLGP